MNIPHSLRGGETTVSQPTIGGKVYSTLSAFLADYPEIQETGYCETENQCLTLTGERLIIEEFGKPRKIVEGFYNDVLKASRILPLNPIEETVKNCEYLMEKYAL